MDVLRISRGFIFPGKRFRKNNNSKLIMKTFRISSFVLVMTLGTAISAFAQENFTANLTHDQETVQGQLVTNPGGQPRPLSFGNASFTLSADLSQLTMTVTVTNIDITGSQTPGDSNDNLVAAHIHAGATAVPGMNAGVVWGFFGAPDNDINPDDLVMTPFASGVGGTFTSIWQAAEGNNTTLTAQINNIRNGLSYINFHTTQFGGGEIRGALVPEPSTIAFLAMGGLGVLYAARKARRKVE